MANDNRLWACMPPDHGTTDHLARVCGEYDVGHDHGLLLGCTVWAFADGLGCSEHDGLAQALAKAASVFLLFLLQPDMGSLTRKLFPFATIAPTLPSGTPFPRLSVCLDFLHGNRLASPPRASAFGSRAQARLGFRLRTDLAHAVRGRQSARTILLRLRAAGAAGRGSRSPAQR